MRISYDPAKRDWTLRHRGIDFEDAAKVFCGAAWETEDHRYEYGETRTICCGYLADWLVVVVYAQRQDQRRIISMRNANAREKARVAPRLEI